MCKPEEIKRPFRENKREKERGGGRLIKLSDTKMAFPSSFSKYIAYIYAILQMFNSPAL